MSGRNLAITVSFFCLSACSTQPLVQLPPAQVVQEPCYAPLEQSAPENYAEVFSSLADLMIYRQQACALPVQERADLLRSYREDVEGTARMASLMLLSCSPNTPSGEFAQTLAAARQQMNAPPGFFAFLELLEAQTHAYVTLKRDLKATEQQLEKMIEGIRTIEAEMGAEEINGRSNFSDD